MSCLCKNIVASISFLNLENVTSILNLRRGGGVSTIVNHPLPLKTCVEGRA